MPLISVILPVYNAGCWLTPAIEGILAQSFSDFELIAVDDASTDGSTEVLKRYAAVDRRVNVLFHERNLHAGVSRNDGLSRARGEYVLFLDADDEFDSNLLERVLAKGQEANADIVLFGADEFEGIRGKCRKNPFYLDSSIIPRVQPFNRDDIPRCLFQLCTPEPWTKLFRRSFVMREGLWFQTGQNANDLYFTMAALAKADRISIVSEPLVHHRIGLSGSIQGMRKCEPLAFLGALTALRDKLKQDGLLTVLNDSFLDLAVFHCLYNSDAPVNWSHTFEDLGVAGRRGSEFYRPEDYGHYLDLVIDSWDGTEDLPAYGKDFWREAVLRGKERAAEAARREAWAFEELERVKSSIPLRLGLAFLWLPRKAKELLGCMASRRGSVSDE